MLVHGAGNTSLVWRSVQANLRHASLAVDLPGRRDRPADLAEVTIDAAARSAAADVAAATSGNVVLVGHSAAGIVLPALAARLDGRVEHLVFVAGLSAPEGGTVADTVLPARRVESAARLAELREQYRGHMLAPDPAVDGMVAIDDARVAMPIESINYMSQTVSWAGVSADLGRTFVRPLRDRIQSRAMQAELIENCAASSVIDIDCGHNAARDAPVELAAILDRVVDMITIAPR